MEVQDIEQQANLKRNNLSSKRDFRPPIIHLSEALEMCLSAATCQQLVIGMVTSNRLSKKKITRPILSG
jgi:hypothetical protein